MKTHIIRIGGLALAGLFFTLLSTASATASPDGAPIPVYDKTVGFKTGWSTGAWGEIDVGANREVFMPDGAVSLQVSAGPGSASYAGVQLVAVGGVELDGRLRREGVVRLMLRNGNDFEGRPAINQELQVMLAFAPQGAKELLGSYERVVLGPASVDGEGTAGWEAVTISIAGMLRGRVDDVTPLRLRGVYIQYIDRPQAGFHIGECVILPTAN